MWFRKRNLRMKKRNFKGFFVTSLILISILSQVSIHNHPLSSLNTEVIVLQVGSDPYVQLAVDTFLKYYPNQKLVQIALIDAPQDLYSEILQFPETETLIFGHGTREGLKCNRELVDWTILKNLINIQRSSPVYVMACYSGEIDQNYAGFNFEIDAEAAGVLSVLAISSDSFSKEEISGLECLIMQKQKDLAHPLWGELEMLDQHIEKEFFWEGLAMVAVLVDRIAMQTVLDGVSNKFIFDQSVEMIKDIYRILNTGASGGRWALLNPGEFNYGYFIFCIDMWSIDNVQYLGMIIPELMLTIYYIVVNNDTGSEIAYLLGFYAQYLFIKSRGEMKKTRKRPDEIIAAQLVFVISILTELDRLTYDPTTYSETASKIVSTSATWTNWYEIAAVWGIGYAAVLCGLVAGIAIGGIATSVKTLSMVIKARIASLLSTQIILGQISTALGCSGDNDGDSLENEYEIILGTDPDVGDSDYDGFNDSFEVLHGFDPLDYTSPARPMYINSQNLEANGQNEITINTPLLGIDRIKVHYRYGGSDPNPQNPPGSWNDYSTAFNVSDRTEFQQNFTIFSTGWTDYWLEFQRQSDVIGSEFTTIYDQFYYAHENNMPAPLDSDGDNLPNFFETQIGTQIGNNDSDADGFLSDFDEIMIYGSNPEEIDSDKDNIPDVIEINENWDNDWDFDNDGLFNWLDFDSDNDGLNDSYEDSNCNGRYDSGTDLSNLFDNDTDNDQLYDKTEILFKLDPKDSDFDNDGFEDGFECRNFLNPRIIDMKDRALNFADQFIENKDIFEQWCSDSGYGDIRTGGLITTTVFTNYEANEDYVVRVHKNSNDWALSSSDRPTIAQYIDGSFYGFVSSWNLTNLRSDDPAEAIESATVTLDYYSNTGWDADDRIKVSLVNLYCNGSYLNDSSSTAHANYSLWLGAYRSIEAQTINPTADSTIDITTLVDYWYLYSNNTLLSLLFSPDPENAFTGTETIVFDQETEDPAISITTGDAVLRADTYGSLASNWHGPSTYHNFGCAIDNFTLDIAPYVEASQASEGKLWVMLYSGDNGTGTQVFKMEWMDNQTANTDCYLKFFDTGIQKWVSTSSTYQSWYNKTSDNATILRNGSTITFFVDGENTTSFVGSTTTIRSLVIQFQQYDTTSVSPKLGLRNIAFQGHSLDYDDDGCNTTTEHSYGTSIWTTDTDADAMPDAFEVAHTPPLDPTVDDAAEDPDTDTLTNYAEYLNGSDPTVAEECLSADILTLSSISKDGSSMTCQMVFNAVGGALYGGGALNVTLFYQYTHYGESASGWIQFYNGIFWVDTGTSLTFNQTFNYAWQYFDKIDVKWEIYAINGTLHDTYWECLDLGTPSVTINTDPEDTFGSVYNGDMAATVDYYIGAEGYYFYRVLYRTRPYNGAWGSWIVQHSDMELFSVGWEQEVLRILASYGEWDDFEVKWIFYDNDVDLNLLDTFTYQYLGASPAALINNTTTELTQIFDSVVDAQAADYDLYFSVSEAGYYRVVVEYDPGTGWEIVSNETDSYSVSSNYHLSDTLCENRYFNCAPFDARFTLYTTANIVISQYSIYDFEFDAPASVSVSSNLVYTDWWDAGEECWTPGSYMCIDTEAAGTYYVKTEYKLNSTGTYTVVDSGMESLSLGFNGLDPLYMISNVSIGSTLYARWRVYDPTGNYLYGSRVESYYFDPAHDTDDDEMPDGWEALYGFDPSDDDDADDDPDYDMISNVDEYAMETDPTYHNAPPDILDSSYLTYSYSSGKWWLNSYMKVDVNNTGYYNVTVEYKVGAGGTWYTVRNQVLELDAGTTTLTDLSLTGVGLSVTCYVRWSVYTDDGEQLYEQYSESKTSYGWWP